MPFIVKPGEIGNAKYVVEEDRLRFVAAAKSVVCVGSYDATYMLCQIIFQKRDGSVLLTFPYARPTPGLISAFRYPSGYTGGPVTIALQETGKVTSHLVKFSHHPDGRVHFSQDGKIRTEVKRESFPLPVDIGEIGQLHVYWPSGFESLALPAMQRDRAYLRYVFQDRLPMAVTVRFEWRRKDDIRSNIEPAGGSSGPVTTTKHRVTGAESLVYFVAQPGGFPLQDHILLVSCSPTDVLDVEASTMIFIGGLDPHARPSLYDPPVVQTGCLAFMYPVDSPEELVSRIGSVDFVSNS